MKTTANALCALSDPIKSILRICLNPHGFFYSLVPLLKSFSRSSTICAAQRLLEQSLSIQRKSSKTGGMPDKILPVSSVFRRFTNWLCLCSVTGTAKLTDSKQKPKAMQILLAYRNIKSNTGSKNAGTNNLTIANIDKLSPEEVTANL